MQAVVHHKVQIFTITLGSFLLYARFKAERHEADPI